MSDNMRRFLLQDFYVCFLSLSKFMRERLFVEKSQSELERAKLDTKIRNLQIKIQNLKSDLNLLSHHQQKIKNNEKYRILGQLEQEKRALIDIRKKKYRHIHRKASFLDAEIFVEVGLCAFECLTIDTDWFAEIPFLLIVIINLMIFVCILIDYKYHVTTKERD